MFLEQVVLDGFRCFKNEQVVSIDPTPGLYLIDSNQRGTTSFSQAIEWCLFNNLKVSPISKGRSTCSVSLTLQDCGVQHTIIRKQHNDNSSLSIDGKQVNQEKIDSILCNDLYSLDYSVSQLSDLNFLKQRLGLDVFDAAIVAAKQDLRSLQEKYNVAQYSVETSKSRIKLAMLDIEEKKSQKQMMEVGLVFANSQELVKRISRIKKSIRECNRYKTNRKNAVPTREIIKKKSLLKSSLATFSLQLKSLKKALKIGPSYYDQQIKDVETKILGIEKEIKSKQSSVFKLTQEVSYAAFWSEQFYKLQNWQIIEFIKQLEFEMNFNFQILDSKIMVHWKQLRNANTNWLEGLLLRIHVSKVEVEYSELSFSEKCLLDSVLLVSVRDTFFSHCMLLPKILTQWEVLEQFRFPPISGTLGWLYNRALLANKQVFYIGQPNGFGWFNGKIILN
jgi:hypothetical protein